MTSKPWPWNTLPEPTPADWGVGMTVCICLHCAATNSLLFAADSMVSTSDISSDSMAFKSKGLGNNWVVMYAENNISSLTPILRDVDPYVGINPDPLANVNQPLIPAIHTQLPPNAPN